MYGRDVLWRSNIVRFRIRSDGDDGMINSKYYRLARPVFGRSKTVRVKLQAHIMRKHYVRSKLGNGFVVTKQTRNAVFSTIVFFMGGGDTIEEPGRRLLGGLGHRHCVRRMIPSVRMAAWRSKTLVRVSWYRDRRSATSMASIRQTFSPLSKATFRVWQKKKKIWFRKISVVRKRYRITIII